MSFADTVVKMGVMRWCVLGLLGFLVLPVSAFYIHLHGVVTEYATGEGMKGVQPDDELQVLPADFHVESCQVLQVPGCQGQRHLLILRRSVQGGDAAHG